MNEAETILSHPGAEDAAAAPGRRLADARQLQGLSAADVARQLKLSVWQVEALEADQYERLPGPIFVRGFIRNYARLVKVDPEELLRSAAKHLPTATPRPEAPPSKDIPFPGKAPQPWPIYAAVVVAIVAVLAVYEFYWSENEAVVVRPAAHVAQPASPQTASAPVAAKASGPEVPAPATARESAVKDQQAIAVAAAAPTAHDAPAAVSGAVGMAQPGERVVRLVFDEESWVEIRDRSGNAIFTQLNPPGTVQEVRGVPPLAVIVGNAHGVRMTYGDQSVDLARHTKIDVARLTLE